MNLRFRIWDGNIKQMFDVGEIDFNINQVIVGDDNEEIWDYYYTGHKQNCDLMQYIGLTDKNGKEICCGDVIKYWDFYESHMSSEDQFGTEPQNSYEVHEVFFEERQGTVKLEDWGYKVNGKYIGGIPEQIAQDYIRCYTEYDNTLNEDSFFEDFKGNILNFERAEKFILCKARKIEVIGNIYDDSHLSEGAK